jgi:hypothetical protein
MYVSACPAMVSDMNRCRSVLLVSLVLAGLLAACGGGTAAPVVSPATPGSSILGPSVATQRSEGGQVTVEATWAGPAAGATFELKLDTHSVDLDALDLSTALLRNDRGEALAARPWSAPKGGHHREGTLAFGDDPGRFLAGAQWIELVLRGVGDVPERTLRWEVRP